jgi:hypothetical protein
MRSSRTSDRSQPRAFAAGQRCTPSANDAALAQRRDILGGIAVAARISSLCWPNTGDGFGGGPIDTLAGQGKGDRLADPVARSLVMSSLICAYSAGPNAVFPTINV